MKIIVAKKPRDKNPSNKVSRKDGLCNKEYAIIGSAPRYSNAFSWDKKNIRLRNHRMIKGSKYQLIMLVNSCSLLIFVIPNINAIIVKDSNITPFVSSLASEGSLTSSNLIQPMMMRKIAIGILI